MAKPTRLTPLRHGEGPWYEQTTGGGVITAPLSALEGPPICPDLGLVFFCPPSVPPTTQKEDGDLGIYRVKDIC